MPIADRVFAVAPTCHVRTLRGKAILVDVRSSGKVMSRNIFDHRGMGNKMRGIAESGRTRCTRLVRQGGHLTVVEHKACKRLVANWHADRVAVRTNAVIG